MNLKTLYATVASFVVYFLLSWLVYGVLLMDYYAANTTYYEGLMNEMPNMVYLIIGGLAWCFLFVFIFQVWAGIKTFDRGFVAGLFIAFLIMFSFDMYFLAGMNLFNLKIIIIDIVLGSIMGGIIGGVAGLVLGAGSRKEETTVQE